MFQTIDCTQLDVDDTTFLMSYPLKSPQVFASIGTVGVVNPIIVSGCACQGKYQIVSGFRRAFACREMGIPVVNAYIHQVDPENLLASFFVALYENTSHRTFNSVEKAIILSKLLNQFDCPRDEVLRNYLPILQLSPNEKVLHTYLSILDFEDEIQHYIAEHDVPMTVIEVLANLAADDRQAVFGIIAALKLGLNKIKEFLTELDEIALRDSCSLRSILEDANIQAVLEKENEPVPQKADQIRRIIHEKRYPQFVALERRYQEHLKQLRLSRGVQLKTDRFFEDDHLAVSFRIQSREDLKTIAEELLKLSQQSDLQDVLDIIQGNMN